MKRYLLTIVLVLTTVSAYAFDFGLNLNFAGGQKKCTDLLPNPSFSPASVAFGEKDTGTTTDQIFTLTNSGTAQLSAASLSVTGTSFTLQSTTCGSNPFDLAVGADCTATVRFAPLTAAAFTGSLTMSAPNLDDVVASLSGTGVAASGVWVTDSFDRADAATLGANWAKYGSSDWLQIVSNSAARVSGDAPFAWWSADTVGADQCSQTTLSNTSTDLSGWPIIRASATAWQFYALRITGSSILVYKYTGQYDLSSLGSFDTTPQIGDVYRICAVGGTIKAYQNGVERISVNDASYSTGNIGIIGTGVAGTISSWAGGDSSEAP